MNDRRRPRPTINNVKPPLGVIPRYIWDGKRKEELAAAIDGYLNAGERIPEEWVEEYNEIVENSTEEVVVNE